MISLLLWAQSLSAQAELIEIADHGGVSTAIYFERITMDDPIENSPMGKPLSPEQVAQHANRFPIHSKLLSPGRVKAQKWQQPAFMSTTIALIGYDNASFKWLRKNRKKIVTQGTMIMVVNVKSQQQFKKIQNIFPGNQMLAMSGDDVARQLKISHYPVLISSKGISQ